MFTKIIKAGPIVEICEYDRKPDNLKKTNDIGTVEGSDDVKAIYTRKPSNPRESATIRRMNNVNDLKKRFCRLARHNVHVKGKPQFMTLTFNYESPVVSEAYKSFRLAMQRFRNKFGSDFAYMAVPEFQSNGNVHFHCLVWGMPQHYGDLRVGKKTISTGSERRHRTLAKLWGHGFVDICTTDGSEHVILYIAKYMDKAVFDERLVKQKAYTRSRNVEDYFELTTESGDTILAFILDGDYGVEYVAPIVNNRFFGRMSYKIIREHT
jgi:hypothetical protein